VMLRRSRIGLRERTRLFGGTLPRPICSPPRRSADVWLTASPFRAEAHVTAAKQHNA
jgi:hypothetical protein